MGYRQCIQWSQNLQEEGGKKINVYGGGKLYILGTCHLYPDIKTHLQADQQRGPLPIIAGSNACTKGVRGPASFPPPLDQSSVLWATHHSILGVT